MKSIYLYNKMKRGKLGVKNFFDSSTCQSVLRLKLTMFYQIGLNLYPFLLDVTLMYLLTD